MLKLRTSPQLERRSLHASEVRAIGDTPGRFEAVVLNYNVRDDYNTEFAPGVFDASMAQKMPRIAWGHDWSNIVGRWLSHRTVGNKLILTGQLDLDMIEGTSTPAVPMAHQAYAQLRSGTVDEFSVGFVPIQDEQVDAPGGSFRRFLRGRLDEVSLVLAGAVPGTALLSVRDGSGIAEHMTRVKAEAIVGILENAIAAINAVVEADPPAANADSTDDASGVVTEGDADGALDGAPAGEPLVPPAEGTAPGADGSDDEGAGADDEAEAARLAAEAAEAEAAEEAELAELLAEADAALAAL